MKRALMIALVALVAGPALAKSGGENMTGNKELGMERCPSAVPGSSTTVSDVPGGVAVTVRAPRDPIAQAQIRERVQFQLEAQADPTRGSIEHTGMGTGSGRYGFCPGMIAETSLAVEWLADGAKMTVTANKAEEAARLQATTHKRAQALAHRMRADSAKR
jgi:hypothetical protein